MSNAITLPTTGAAISTNWMWGAIGVLGISTLAMGAALVQMRQAAPAADVVMAAAPQQLEEVIQPTTPVASLPAPALPAVTVTKPAQTNSQKVASKTIEGKKPAIAPMESAPAAPKTVAKTAPAPAEDGIDWNSRAQPGADEGVAAAKPAPLPAPVCAVCGTVESVTPVQRELASGSGAGAIAGAVLGGVIGNQMGQGMGKDIATVIGMAAGGWAGNNVEKQMKKETVYQVTVRMEDRSTRTIEQKTPLAVGTRVTVDGNTLSPAANSGARTAV